MKASMLTPELDEGDELRELPVDWIIPDPTQDRGDWWESPAGQEEIAGYAASMRTEAGGVQVGVSSPIEVTKVGNRQFMIVFGEGRWRSAKLAGLETIPSLIRSKSNPELRSLRQLIENIQRNPLDAWRLALAVQKRIDGDPEKGIPPRQAKDLAEQLGKSRAWVSRATAVLSMPEDIQQLCRDRVVGNVDTLRELERYTPEERAVMIERLRAGDPAKEVVVPLKAKKERQEKKADASSAKIHFALMPDQIAQLLRRLGEEEVPEDPIALKAALIAQVQRE